MYKVLAMLRASWLGAASYKVSLMMSILGLLVTTIPVYFIANALQTTMAPAIAAETDNYFGFVLVGMIAMSMLGTAMEALPQAVSGGIGSGTLEALLSTRTRLPIILAGMVSYNLTWVCVRMTVVLLAGWFLGVTLFWSHVGAAILILALIALSYLPIGLIAASLIMTFRTAGPLTRVVLLASTLLGGVYIPTTSMPEGWIERLPAVIPLTYGLRPLRRTLLEGASLADVMPDLAILSAFVVVLLTVGAIAFTAAFRHARRTGTLAIY